LQRSLCPVQLEGWSERIVKVSSDGASDAGQNPGFQRAEPPAASGGIEPTRHQPSNLQTPAMRERIEQAATDTFVPRVGRLPAMGGLREGRPSQTNLAYRDALPAVSMVPASKLGYPVDDSAVLQIGDQAWFKRAGLDAYVAVREDESGEREPFTVVLADEAHGGLPRGYASIDPKTGAVAYRMTENGPAFPGNEEDLDLLMALLAHARDQGLKLRLDEAVSAMGAEPRLRIRSPMDAARYALPFVKTRNEKLAGVLETMRDREAGKQSDQQAAAELRAKVESMTAQQAALRLAPASAGGPDWLHAAVLTSGVAGPQSEGGEPLYTGYLLRWPAEVTALLEPEDGEALESRRVVWEGLNVESGAMAAELLDTHFSATPFRADGPLPLEVASLIRLDPSMRQILNDIQPKLDAQGANPGHFEWNLCTKAPAALLGHVRNRADTHGNMITPWLEPLIVRGVATEVDPSDVDAIRDELSEQLLELRSGRGGPDDTSLERTIRERQLLNEGEARLDLSTGERVMRDFSRAMLFVSATGLSEDDAAKLQQLNDALFETYGSRYAIRRITADEADSTSEVALDVIKALAAVGPLAELLQDGFNLTGLAAALAAMGDNVGAFIGDSIASIKANVPKEELLNRVLPISLAGVAGTVGTLEIEWFERVAGGHVAGGVDLLCSVIMEFVTTGLSIRYFAKSYRKLEGQGRLPARFVPTDEIRAQLDALAQSDEITPKQLIDMVDNALREAGVPPSYRRRVVDRIEDVVGTGKQGVAIADAQHALESATQEPLEVSGMEAFQAGWAEATQVNPSRKWMTVGAAASPIVGLVVGKWIFISGLVETLFGSVETDIGVAGTLIEKHTFSRRWRREVESITEARLAAMGPPAQTEDS
jgi:hypothetical protein